MTGRARSTPTGRSHGRSVRAATTTTAADSGSRTQSGTGSEWPTVLGVLHEAHMPMLSRNLVYTALTRARERFYAAGSASAWVKAAGRQREERNTALLERVRGR